jgi:hypothetical protein
MLLVVMLRSDVTNLILHINLYEFLHLESGFDHVDGLFRLEGSDEVHLRLFLVQVLLIKYVLELLSCEEEEKVKCVHPIRLCLHFAFLKVELEVPFVNRCESSFVIHCFHELAFSSLRRQYADWCVVIFRLIHVKLLFLQIFLDVILIVYFEPFVVLDVFDTKPLSSVGL